MAYQRKTQDEYQIHGNYGDGFEEVCCASTRKEAILLLKEHRENEPYPFQLRKVRVPRTEDELPLPVTIQHPQPEPASLVTSLDLV